MNSLGFITNQSSEQIEDYLARIDLSDEPLFINEGDEPPFNFPAIETVEPEGWSLLSIFYEAVLIENPQLIYPSYGYAVIGSEILADGSKDNLVGVFEKILVVDKLNAITI